MSQKSTNTKRNADRVSRNGRRRGGLTTPSTRGVGSSGMCASSGDGGVRTTRGRWDGGLGVVEYGDGGDGVC